jgi:hypothetical protein
VCTSLLGATVATDVFCPSLLYCNCSDVLVVTGQLPVATMTYGLLVKRLFVIVYPAIGITNLP